jgi:hypothetical protein
MRCSAAFIFAALLAFHDSAWAGVFTDDLSKCLVSKSTDADKLMLARWVFVGITANKSIKDLATVTPEQRENSHKQAAALLDKLLTTDCRPEAVQAAKYEGGDAIETSFGTLGEVAMRALVNDPAVNQQFEYPAKYFDLSRWQAIFDEAGIPWKAAPKKE